MPVTAHWIAGEPCPDCGCTAICETPVGEVRAHLVDCPRVSEAALRDRLRGAVEEIERLRREVADLREVNARLAQAERDAVAARTAALDRLGGRYELPGPNIDHALDALTVDSEWPADRLLAAISQAIHALRP